MFSVKHNYFIFLAQLSWDVNVHCIVIHHLIFYLTGFKLEIKNAFECNSFKINGKKNSILLMLHVVEDLTSIKSIV